MPGASHDTASDRPASPVAALLVGGGLLLVGALVVFWPGGDRPEPVPVEGAPGTGADGAAGAKRGGIPKRAVDEASHGSRTDAPRPRLNKALRAMPTGMGEAVPPPSPPETFSSPEEERKWYAEALERARSELEFRRKAVERLDKVRDEIERSKDPEQARATYERRRAIVEDNLQRAEERVRELERKLESLGGPP